MSKRSSLVSSDELRSSRTSLSRINKSRWATFFAPVTEDTATIENRRSKVLPLLLSPLDAKPHLYAHGRYEGDGELLAEGAKTGLPELFYDLFLIACLVRYTSNHELIEPETIASFILWFSLIWTVWASQSLYDVRFETGDMVHVVAKLVQFSVLASFGAYAANFHVNTGLGGDVVASFDGQYLMQTTAEIVESEQRALKATAMTYAVSRFLLALQYFLAYFQLRSSGWASRRFFFGQIIALCVSGLLFLTTYFFVASESKGLQIAKLVFWCFGVSVEMLTSWVLAIWRPPRHTVNIIRTHLAERIGTLTLVILGEGVIGLLARLEAVMYGIGWQENSRIAISLSLLIVYLICFVYFDNNTAESDLKQLSAARTCLWTWLHYPFHTTMLLVLEGMNTAMLFTNIFNAVPAVGDAATRGPVIASVYPQQGTYGNSSFTFGTDGYTVQFNGTNASAPDFLQTQFTSRDASLFLVDYATRVLNDYQFVPPQELLDLGNAIIANQTSDIATIQTNITQILLQQYDFTTWFLIGASALYFALSAVIILVQAYPTHRYGWIAIYARFMVAVACIVIDHIALLDDDEHRWTSFVSNNWLLPTIAIAMGLVICCDLATIYFGNRAFRRRHV